MAWYGRGASAARGLSARWGMMAWLVPAGGAGGGGGVLLPAAVRERLCRLSRLLPAPVTLRCYSVPL